MSVTTIVDMGSELQNFCVYILLDHDDDIHHLMMGDIAGTANCRLIMHKNPCAFFSGG